MRLKNSLSTRFMVGMAAVITVVMTVNLFWNISQYRRQAGEEMREKAAVLAQQLIAVRSFIALQQDAINTDSSGNYEFKHLNPARVGRGVSEIMSELSGYRFKQTNFQVRDAANAPDNFEIEKMRELVADQSLKEVWGNDVIEGVPVFRYVAPLYYDASCMSCHGQPAGTKDVTGHIREGYRSGDFAGAISIVFPMLSFEANQWSNVISQLTFIIFMLIAAIAIMYVLMEYIIVAPLKELTERVSEFGRGQGAGHSDIQTYDEMRVLTDEFNTMAMKLKQLHNELEQKVIDRTQMLQEANNRLGEQGRELQIMNARLSKADQLKSEFLAVMSHELRTPLTSIIAFSEILLAECEGMSAEQREYLGDIFDSSHQLLGQINDILNMSKIEAGLLRLNCQSFDIRQVLDSISRVMAPLMVKKQITFAMDIAEDLPEVWADYEKIRHIISNLISNAVKFTPRHGKITVVVSLAALRGKLFHQITVRDTGSGISAGDQFLIFNKFRQSSDSRDVEHAGSGLGLSIVRNLVELHGGRVWVDSMPGQGSEFVVMLPAADAGEELC